MLRRYGTDGSLALRSSTLRRTLDSSSFGVGEGGAGAAVIGVDG